MVNSKLPDMEREQLASYLSTLSRAMTFSAGG